MPQRRDQDREYASLIASLAEAVEAINASRAKLPALTDLLATVQDSLGAAGMSFAEYGTAGGRVIAATGAVESCLGVPVDLTDPAQPVLRRGPRVQDLPLDWMPARLAADLCGRGLSRALYCRAELGPLPVGHVNAYYRDPHGSATPAQRALIRLVAACAAHLYARQDQHAGQNQLPAQPDGPGRELFIAVTSHELRTPVTVIKGYADTLTDHWESLAEPDRREMLRTISQRSAELARLVDRLLCAATDDGDVCGRSPVPFDLIECLRAAVSEMPAQLRRRLVTDLPARLPKALGDRASLATVLTELVTNADKYTDDNAVPVELSAGSDAQSVFFRVSDRGVGVSPEHVERAFDRFWQGESGNRRRYPGTGLGLYLVRRIVERQNGWVSLRPREQGGTVAEVRLPRGDLVLRRRE